MRSLIPVLRLAPDGRTAVLRAKFGGLPWGLPPHRWPACREYGKPMSCLAQIPVRGHLDQAGPLAGRADLSGKVLHVLTCERLTICDFWDPRSGANASFFLDADEIQHGTSAAATPIVPVLPEVWIEGWTPHDDPVPEEAAASFTDETRFYALQEGWQFPHDFDTALRTKLGGVPYWTGQGPGGGPYGAPQPPFRFLMQIDKFLAVPEAGEDGLDLANFCSDGTGFVFVDTGQAGLPALFLINR